MIAAEPVFEASPRLLSDPRELLRERLGGAQEALQVGGGAAQAAQRRDLAVGGPLELGQGGPQLAEELRQPVPIAAQLLRARGLDRRGVRRLARPAGHVLAEGLDLGAHRVRVADEVADDRVLAAQDPQRLGQLAQRRVGAADHAVQLLRAAGQAGAQLRDDQPEALAVGAAHHVVDQVGRDRRRRALGRDPPPVGDPLGRLPEVAVEEVLADQRLLAHVAARVLAQRVEARHVDLGLHHRAVGLGPGDLEVGGLARLDATDLQVAALGQAEGVVHLDLDRPQRVGSLLARP